MALPSGARLGPYEIRSVLGSGGMGDVYVARDTNLNRDVALKLLPADLTSDPERLRRFEQEARAASALNHPAIVAIYELGQAGTQPYISMELVEGQTLRQMLESGAMPPRRALHIAAQIADGLAKAHEAGIVHRDLKPENLMVSPDGFAKILDFGLAKLVDEAAGSRTASLTATEHGTRPGSVLGTVGYMSPEQASGQGMDSRSDQFSFGLVLYEMLTGRRAFARPTAVETMSAIIREDPPPVDQHSPAVPAPVRWMVDRCLAKAPAERYASTRDLARDLAGARDRFSELTTATAIARPTPRVSRREAIAWTAVALLGAAVVGLALRGGGRAPADPPRPLRFTIAPPANGTFGLNIGSSPFAISPDGHHLAFAAIVDGRRQLWLRSFDALVSRPIPDTEGAEGPFWSPDGLAIGFFADNRLKRVPVSGGEATTICETRGGGGATWNRDGVIVFAPSVDSGLYRVAEAGGTATAVTALDSVHGEAAHVFPLFLPDGRRFVFQVFSGENTGVHVGSLDASSRKRLLPEPSIVGFSAPDYLVFVRDRNILAQRIDLARLEPIGDPALIGEDVARAGPSAALAVSASGAVVYWSGGQEITQPTWVQRDGTPVGTVGPPAAYMNLALSQDGRRAALDRFDTPGIWLLDVGRGTLTRSTFGGAYESTPIWAPDGRSLAFAAARDAPPNLFLKRLETAGEDERLFRTSIQSFPQSWSPDGQFIAYITIDPKTGGDIWVLPLAGDRKPAPLIQTPYFQGFARISPDGHWLAYASDESGGRAVYVTRFPQPAAKWPVSTGGGSHPVWSRNGRELFYRAPDGTLMSVAVKTGPEFEAAAPQALFSPRATPGSLGFGTFYDVAPDGRFLINMFVERSTSPATVVLNWRAAITRPEAAR